MNNNIEILSNKNPFIYSEINENNIGSYFGTDSANTGDIVCISSLYGDLITRFGSYENAKKVYEFARSLLVKGQYNKYGLSESIPYLNFTVYLEQDMNDNGVLSPYCENWVPGKRYYIGDTVYYSIDGTTENMKTYTLVSGDSTEIIEVTKAIYEANQDDDRYVKDGDRYYFEVAYYTGFFSNTTKLTYFDETDLKGNFKHWSEDVSTGDSSYDYSGVTGQTESLLSNIMRKKSDMDISGNTLPFILHYKTKKITLGGKEYEKRIVDTASTETFYMCGYTNIRYNSDKSNIMCDALESMTFYNFNDGEESGVTFSTIDSINKPIFITIDENKNVFVTTNGEELYDIYSFDTVKFVYYINASMIEENKKWVRKENTGVMYEETRSFSLNNSTYYNIEYDNGIITCILPSIKIEANTESFTRNADLSKSNRTVNYSNISVTEKQIKRDSFLNVKTFKDDSTSGLQNVTKNIDVNIDRGIAESYQKHNMLGEICSLQDLENYKNGKYLK